MYKDISGEKYGRLTAIERTEKKTKNGSYYWVFKCECGNTKVAPMNPVRSGLIKSCGCMCRPHGDTGTRLHTIWVDMRMRCKHNGKYWGAKGVSVCEEWNDYIRFKEWALRNGYTDEKTIDRIDGDGNYTPDNCRWATYKEQANNFKSNRKVTINGETHNVSEWCEILKIVTRSAVYKRVRKGWSYELALTTPGRRGRRKETE